MKPDLKKLKELCDNATPGPWKSNFYQAGNTCVVMPDGITAQLLANPEYSGLKNSQYQRADNGQFIAEARNQMPALLDYCERLEKVAEEAKNLLKLHWVEGSGERGPIYMNHVLEGVPKNRLKEALAALESAEGG